MPLALTCMSHSPLLEFTQPPEDVAKEVDAAFASARGFVKDYDPELVVVFGPDHYNGFFYELMPPYCIGLQARGIGDFGTAEGPLNVPRETAHALAQAALNAGVDLAVSLRMEVDHGIVQPLEILFGAPDSVPVVPVFLNSVAPPFTPMERVRALGQALGTRLAQSDQRILLVGSGGLSHDPPVPRLADATPEAEQRLISNRNPTAQMRAARQQRIIDAAASFAAGDTELQDLNPEWDNAFLDHLAAADFDAIDAYSNDDIVAQGGNSAQEIRSWIAAYAALSAAGPYRMTSRYYRPIKEYIAGFSVTTALPTRT